MIATDHFLFSAGHEAADGEESGLDGQVACKDDVRFS